MAEHVYKNNYTWSVEQGSIAPQLDYNRKPKYIVKNCPAYCYLGEECHNEEGQYGVSCCKVTDCIIKQVINECDKIIIDTQNAEIDVMLERSGITDAEKSNLYGQCKMARKILNLFDIEEINK